MLTCTINLSENKLKQGVLYVLYPCMPVKFVLASVDRWWKVWYLEPEKHQMLQIVIAKEKKIILRDNHLCITLIGLNKEPPFSSKNTASGLTMKIMFFIWS